MNGTTHVRDLLNQYDFLENEDYLLSKVREQVASGTKYKNEYYLHPRAFKICLMRSIKTKKYARYYLLLEECIKYFNEYQIELNKKYLIIFEEKINEKDNIINEKNNIIKEKDNNISSLELKLNQIISTNNQIISSNNKLEEQLNKANNNLDKANDNLEDIKYDLDEVKDELKDTNIKLDISLEDRVPKTKSLSTREFFILLKTNKFEYKYKYYVLRGQKRYIDRKLENMNDFIELKRYMYTPNAINLLLRIKEKLKTKMIVIGNKFNIININEEDFLNKINNIYEEKNIIYY
jgi:DNA repair exonuclease SbcCD ATPase subunit